ncbi:tetratricopeptide repeat protein [Usitatibacter palustris]|nr:tetratricopeptide repeat protein [Usitatibacter palustris]
MASLYELLHEAATHHQAGRLAAAATLYRSVLAAHPYNSDAHHNLGVLAMQEGRGLDDALPHFKQAWENDPSHPQYGLSYVKALTLANRPADARVVHADGLRRGLAWPPLAAMQPARSIVEPPEGWRLHASRLLDTGLLLEALDGFSRALGQRADDVEAQLGLARTLAALSRHEEAARAFREVLAVRPEWTAALVGHARALVALGRTPEAEASYRRALALEPSNADAYSGIGVILLEARRFAEAEALCRSVLARAPWRFDVHHDLGTLLTQVGRIEEARVCYREVLALRPDHLEARSCMLFLEHYTATRPSAALLEQSRAYGTLARTHAPGPYRAWSCTAHPGPLRVGLVSGDLREHPVGFFIEGLVAHADPARIEWIAYPTLAHTDELSGRLRKHMRGWRSLVGLPDAQAAQRIHDDGVHVLLDLAGHTMHNRLPVFAWKPAPVAASWLGYFATTGVAEIDYVLADRVSIPESLAPQFTERVLYLPDTRLCFTAPENAPEPRPLPAPERGHVTFGCFQSHPKITEEVLAAWSRILAACPGSRLRVQNASLAGADGVRAFHERLARAGIAGARVDLHGVSLRDRYLAECGEVDFLLDTFPYPGGTTTCEALWMGVPTLTLEGETMIARQGASLLAAAGLGGWIARTADEYVALAIERARDVAGLAALRLELRERVRVSALFDAPRFARAMEGVLFEAWNGR